MLATAVDFNPIIISIAAVITAGGAAILAKLNSIGKKVDGRLDDALSEIRATRATIDAQAAVISKLTGEPLPPTVSSIPSAPPAEPTRVQP